MLAKLPVSGPRYAAIDLERKRIDQNRAAVVKLEVESAAILERHPTQERRRCTSSAARAASRNALKLHSLGYEMNSTRSGRRTLYARSGSAASVESSSWRNEQAGLDQLVVQPAGKQPIVMFAVNLVYLPPQLALVGIDKSGGVAK